MPRKYSHIQEHEKEIIELRSQGMTLRQIGEKLGFTYKEMRGFLSRYNRKQRKLAAGVPPKPRVYLKIPQRCSILPKSSICCVAFACIPQRSAALMRLASGAFWRISQHV